MGQAALVVLEPHAELNAGLIVIFRSSHPSLFDWNAWSLRLRSSSGSITEDVYKEEASNLAFAFWDRMGEFLKRSRTCSGVPGSALSQWLVGIDVDAGPDERNSSTFVKQNFDV